ncbi:MAG: alpha/beta fold hydrolase, partial [Cyanobacteria bacterium J06641_5]
MGMAIAGLERQVWQWRGFNVGYRCVGKAGPAVVLVHGFGASSGHWRKNLPVLGESCRCFAIDLLGFGASDKPRPDGTVSYTFETWADQIIDFCREVVGESAFLIGNSIGCIAAMQAGVSAPDWVRGIAALNIS